MSLSLAQVKKATANFDPAHKLAEGAFGAVFRGELEGGVAVAIKALTKVDDGDDDGGDYSGAGSFALEAKVLGQYRHANIVQLVGHCLGDGPGQHSYLAYEFMAGGSLFERLHCPTTGKGKGSKGSKGSKGKTIKPLTWQQRHVIASDAARGLEYLHVTADPPIIHQDIKTDNILLGEYQGHLVAKIADFGAVRIAPTLLTNTHLSAREVIGTKPYQPPEYAGQGHVSEKTDTFAFGVVLLELLTGQPPRNGDTNEFLYSEQEPMLQDPRAKLPPRIDARAGPWPLRSALALATIAKQCLEMHARNRCAVREVLVELDVLAGRKAIRRAGRGEEYDPDTGKLVRLSSSSFR